ncbi:hypothetical protein K491DRAFT_76420 [Lophiostoma macrostomum CBS 122681]|uniref:C2H2-type domain-containing protein n=1 Tax=Lophiostoma macrostomum CBS 122681 TaxID=1314788 RepID=A0A6A6SVV8_9PLEO|nr:hypothetical protein K491DRAFT_76420 [Lophiostoma macrostomum CBS 122681]
MVFYIGSVGNTEESVRRLARPYYKHNPRIYRATHPCLGPGWNSIHRLKLHEVILLSPLSLASLGWSPVDAVPRTLLTCRDMEHLYRRHAQPPQCTRCRQTFESDSELKDHSRLLEGCQLRDEESLEGFDNDQERRLRSRKKGFLDDTRKETYLILFPDTLLLSVRSISQS